MTRVDDLEALRQQLAHAEKQIATEDGLNHLRDGLALLEDLVDSDDGDRQRVARNIGQTYATRIYEQIAAELAADKNAPEPLLEQLFAVIRALDDGPFELPAESREIKIGVVKRLIDRYYEGHPQSVKDAAFAQLDALTRGDGGR
ncbi:MAG: hypothetical protein R3305_05910 [Gammaproteobacteria bacterium]|nr:hypothetical protein [Gammaproteobacteria bacterium]